MRTVRLSLMGVTLLALAVGQGCVIAAQDQVPQDAAPHAVTGAIVFEKVFQSYVPSEDGLSRRGEGWELTSTFDDARLSGPMWIVWNRDTLLPRPPSHLWSGTTRIENADGVWVGTLQGYTDPGARLEHFVFELSGDDGYEGYSALLRSSGRGDGREVEGFVFPGKMPPYPEPVVPAAQ